MSKLAVLGRALSSDIMFFGGIVGLSTFSGLLGMPRDNCAMGSIHGHVIIQSPNIFISKDDDVQLCFYNNRQTINTTIWSTWNNYYHSHVDGRISRFVNL